MTLSAMKFFLMNLAVIVFLVNCESQKNADGYSARQDESKEDKFDLINRIRVKVITDESGLVEEVTTVRSIIVGTEFRAKSHIKIYDHDFDNGSTFSFKSSQGELNISCDGPSAYGSWPFFPGGKLFLVDGRVKKVIGDVGSGGNSIDNQKFVSEKFLETDKSLEKYGFKLVSFEVEKLK